MKIQSARVQPAVMIMDCLGKHVLTNDSNQDATLIFIDLVPQANWGHDCLYILVQHGNQTKKVKHRWPPGDNTTRDLVDV